MHPDEYQEIIDMEERISKLDEQLKKGSWPKAKPLDDGWHKILRDPNIGKVVERQWGYYKILHQGDGYLVKELTILPGKSLSDQRHFKRDEQWFVVKGKLTVDLESYTSAEHTGRSYLDTDHEDYSSSLFIPRETWHRPYNEGTEEVKVIETWIGDSSEDDIERRNT